MKRPIAHRALAGMAFTLLALAGCTPKTSDDGGVAASTPIMPSLIPAPAALQTGEGAFAITADTRLAASGEAATRVAQQFAAYLQSAGGPALATTQDEGCDGSRGAGAAACAWITPAAAQAASSRAPCVRIRLRLALAHRSGHRRA